MQPCRHAVCVCLQVQDNLRAALQVAADEAAKQDHDEPIPSPVEVAQLVEEAMFGFYGATLAKHCVLTHR